MNNPRDQDGKIECAFEHDEDAIEESVAHPGDPLWGYCYACCNVVVRPSVDASWDIWRGDRGE